MRKLALVVCGVVAAATLLAGCDTTTRTTPPATVPPSETAPAGTTAYPAPDGQGYPAPVEPLVQPGYPEPTQQ